MANAHILQSPGAVTYAPDDFAELDPIMNNSNGAFRFVVDTAYPRCYPGGDPNTRSAAGAPADGAVLYDSANRADGAFRKASGQTVTYAGGGFALSAVTARGCYIEAPASVNADIYTAAPAGSDNVGGTQAWAECLYIIMPNPTTWTGVTAGKSYPIHASVTESYYGNGAERCWIGIKTDGTMEIIFQQSVGGTINTNFKAIQIGSVDTSVHYGLLTQIVIYRKADGTCGVRLKSSAGTTTPSTITTTANTADYSARVTRLGVTSNTTWPASGMNLSATKFRLFRWWIANLNRKAFDPITKADTDWTYVQLRKDADSSIFSAA